MFVKRDPFARTELHRHKEHNKSCDWCGSQCHRKGERPFVWRYRTEMDGGHVHYDGRVFCSTTCRNSYTS